MSTTILSKKKSTYGSPYVYYTVSVEVTKRTPTSVKLKYTVTAWLQYDTSYLLTGHPITVSLYVGDSWHDMNIKSSGTSWKGTAKHKKTSSTITVSGVSKSATALKGVKFKAEQGGGTAGDLPKTSCSNIPIADVDETYDNVTLLCGDYNQAKALVTLSNIPAPVEYARTIKWYKNDTEVGVTEVASSSSKKAYGYKYTGLLPNSKYTFKAKIYYGSTSLTTKSVAVTTPNETGTLSLLQKATYINATVADMFDGPNYTRTVEFYVKRSSETSKDAYTLVAAISTQLSDVQLNITGLVSNASYDVKALIKNDETILKTLVESTVTSEDMSLIPTAAIESIMQQFGTRLCTIEWITDKLVAGTMYVIQAKGESETEWTDLSSASSVISPTIVTSPSVNENVSFRIKAFNESVAEALASYSEIVTLYVHDGFTWDVDKVAGEPVIITANEWNRLKTYALEKNATIGHYFTIADVNVGDSITAQIYNTLKNIIMQAKNSAPTMILGMAKLGMGTLISYDSALPDKRKGDVIVAIDIDRLRIEVNKTWQ